MPFILGTNSIKDTGYNVDNSLRFNTGSSDYLNRSASGSANVTEATISVWIKRASIGGDHNLYNGAYQNNNTYYFRAYINSDDQLEIENKDGSTNLLYKTNRKFRDLSSWYNIVIKLSLTASGNDRCKVFINGVQETSFATQTAMSGDQFFTGKNNYTVQIGETHAGENDYFNGYMSEFVYVQGTALDPTSFGEFDSDSPTIWKPIDVSGLTFGANGLYLEFKQSGTSANSSGLGADTSGNDNHMTVNNLTGVDQSTDTCTNNFSNMNPLDNFYASSTFSEGNLQFVTTNGNYTFNTSTFGVSSGKWYAEVEFDAVSGGSGAARIGVAGKVSTATSNGLGDNTGTAAYMSESGQVHFNGSDASYGDTYATGDVIGIALDVDNSKLYFSKNGTFQNSGDPTSGATGTGAISITAVSSTDIGFYFIAVGEFDSTYNYTFKINFGSPPYSISSGNADANGHGNFEYAVPSGYFALCSKNLAEHG